MLSVTSLPSKYGIGCFDKAAYDFVDWLGLDNSTRMNTPGTVVSNRSWRLVSGQVTEMLGEEVRNVSKRYGRANWDTLKALEEKEAEK